MRPLITRRTLIQVILLLVGLILLGYFIVTSGIIENHQLLTTVNISLLGVAFILSLGNILVKVYRWKYLSACYSQPISWKEASLVSISSLFFANIAPGKIGDLYKAYFMKMRYGLNFLDGVSMIFYERFFELSILFVVATGIAFTQLQGITVIILEITFLLLIVGIFLYYKVDTFLRIVQKVLVKLPLPLQNEGLDLYIRKIPLFDILVVCLITLVSLVLEFIRLWVVVIAFGYLLNPFLISIYMSLAIIIGLVSQIPLGIGAMEGSLNHFITSMGVPSAVALAIVLVDRMISMYFALVLGLIFSKFSFDALQEV